MSQTKDESQEKKYRVQVGRAECTVSCGSATEAVRLARSRLADEMPQMWDVIQGIAEKEFRVDQIS
jgi:hypothetical protein